MRWQFKISDGDLAQALGVSRTTAENYRKELEGLALVTVERKSKGKKKEIRIKSVKY